MLKKRKVIIVVTIISALILLYNLAFDKILLLYLANKYNISTDLSDAVSIGIIGGADGPTSIYLGKSESPILFNIIFLIVMVAGIIYLMKTKKNKLLNEQSIQERRKNGED
jgi:Na+-transporting methylmalonyl-CoA/oxaloacetate decarboxylase beta subunit